MKSNIPCGFLLIDKPDGWTSFDAVAKVRGIVRHHLAHLIDSDAKRKVKVGHCGTLDPAATGLLILAVGRATKQISDLVKSNKTYQVKVTLGTTSNTGDKEGELIKRLISKEPLPEQVYVALRSLIGKQMQTPHAFSAKKVNGRRAYDLARKGKEVMLKPQEIEVISIENINYTWPVISFLVEVSSGTYVRSLAEEIGERLGTGAYMSALRRLAIDEYRVEDAISPAGLSYEEVANSLFAIEN